MKKQIFIFCFIFTLLAAFFIHSQIKQDYSNSIFSIPFPIQQFGIVKTQILVHPCNGPDTINITLQNTVTSVKLFWRKNSNPWDSVTMINTGGYNWRGIFYTSGSGSYGYYIKFLDSIGRVGTAPAGAPANYYNFIVGPDTLKPVITHTPIENIPLVSWPATVNATITDNCGIDSVWVRWKINNGITRYFKLINTSGNNYSAIFNSMDVAIGDVIHYKIFSQDNSSQHNKDSTYQIDFNIINQIYNCVGTDSALTGIPFNTYWFGSRTQMLYTASEIIASGGQAGSISRIGFYIYSSSSQPMNGFTIRMQNININSLTGFVYSDWTTCYNGNYTVPGTGLQFITLQTPFNYFGTNSLLIEICFGNTSYTTASIVRGTNTENKVYSEFHDIQTACTTFQSPTVQAIRPNICMVIIPISGVNNNKGSIPSRYNLSQNYPNPFNPVTRINFDIPKQGLVSLKIYDILGREVKVLVNEIKTPGSYSVDYNASNFSSGTYFYRLESGGFSDVKRMLMIK